MKQYRIVFEAGRYFPEERIFFMWFRPKIEAAGYKLDRHFPSYKEALGYIYLHNKERGDRKYRIVM